MVLDDVTDRREGARELQRLASSLRLALAAADSGTYRRSPGEGTVQWTEEYAELYGFAPGEEASFERWLQRVDHRDRDRLITATERLLAGDDDWSEEFRIRHPTKGLRWIRSVVSVRRDDQGAAVEIVGLNSDVTDRKRDELRLAQLHRRQRDIAKRLQEGLLSTSPTSIAGHDVAAAYLTGTRDLTVGGDWFDVIRTRSGFALVIGDAVGHDLDAVTAMAQVRFALAGLVQTSADPTDALRALDDLATSVPAALGTTVYAGFYDPSTGMLHHATAGHPPPLLRRGHGEVVALEPTRLPPVGVAAPTPSISLRADSIEPGDTLILYTDGLVEQRGRSITEGIAAAMDRFGATGSSSPLQAIADELAATRPSDDDDVAVLAVRRHRTGG